MPTIDIDRDAAHEAAQHELAKPIYPKASLTDRLLDWISELFYRLMDATAGVPGGPKGAVTRLGMKRFPLPWKMKRLGISRAI